MLIQVIIIMIIIFRYFSKIEIIIINVYYFITFYIKTVLCSVLRQLVIHMRINQC